MIQPKWYSKRLEAIAAEIEKGMESAGDDEHHYLSEALSSIMDADDNLGSAYWTEIE